MITLYGVYRSRASRPLWLLHEIGIPFIHVPVIQAYRLADPHAPDAPPNTASRSFRELNPQGEIPTLEEDGLILTESLAITLHIARAYGKALGPVGLVEHALTDQWALFAATALEAPGIDIYYTFAEGRQGTPEGEATVAAAAEKLRRPLARLDQHLRVREWLLGDRFTVADICVAECLRYGAAWKPLLHPYPEAQAWLARCHARPAFRTMWEKRLAEPQ
jgi:glutathione S-transferase